MKSASCRGIIRCGFENRNNAIPNASTGLATLDFGVGAQAFRPAPVVQFASMFKRAAPPICALAIVVAGLAPAAQSRVAADAAVDKVFARWTRETPGCAVGASVNGTTAVQKA